MGGCLGPKQRRQQVYIQMIETIHEEVTHMTFSHRNQSLDMYQAIKQKLAKKGLLRKLIDNLVSHKNKIYDSLNHNYQIVLQNSKIQSKYAGLLIFDQIIEGINDSLKASKGNNDSQDFTNMSNHVTKDFLLEQSNKMSNNKSANPKKYSNLMQSNPLIRQIDVRFDLIYFSLIKYLLQNVSKMYLRILKSINSFCLHKKNKFNCTQIVWQVLNYIMIKIGKDYHLKESTLTYYMLLENTRQNFKDFQAASDLKTFIKIWISSREKCTKVKTPERLMLHTQESSVLESQDIQSLVINAIKIISLSFNTNISTWNSQYLYDIMIDVYDEYEFDFHRLSQFQNAIFEIIIRNDLHVQFFRGLFVQLLEYLCFRINPRTSRGVSGLNSNAEEIRWINVSNKNVKFNAIKTLRRWVNKKHVNLNETVSFNCSLLVSSYIDNFHPLEASQNIEISKEFLKLIREHLTPKSKQILVSSLIQHIKNGQTDSRIRTLIVSIMRQLLQDQQIFAHFGQDFDYILTIDEHYSQENQMEIVQLMGFIVKALPGSFFSEKCDPNASQIINFKHHICEFLYSCFQVIMFGSADQLFKYRFCCALVSFLRAIQSKNCLTVIYAFFLELMKYLMVPSTAKHIPNKNYYILYLTYETSHILVNEIRVPTDFKILNEKVSSTSTCHSSVKSSKNRKDQISTLIQKIVIQDKYLEPNLIRQQFRSRYIQGQIEESKTINKENFQSTCKILRNYFATPFKNSRNMSTHQENDEVQSNNMRESENAHYSSSKNGGYNPFGRRDSIYHQSQSGSYYKEEDKNIKDVLNIINN